MSAAIETFKRLVVTYYRSVKSGGVECRIVIPGLTPTTCSTLHKILRIEGLPSVLVVPSSMSPSREDGLIHAEGLTSIRQGDMVIITYPGELSKLQDGISGAGGAIRNFAISDEWPWIDDGNEYFRFRTVFLREILELWGASADDAEWLATIINRLVSSTQASLDRAVLFLEEVLGAFDPASNAKLSNLREKFLFHAGMPRPAGEITSSSAEEFIERLDKLAVVVRRSRVEPDFRSEVLGRVDRLVADPAQRSILSSQVTGVLDGLAINAERQYSGVLSFRGCWAGDVTRWSSLTLDRLVEFFDPMAGAQQLQLRAVVGLTSGLLSPDQRHAILFEESRLGITTFVDGIDASQVGAAAVLVVQGSRILKSANVSWAEGSTKFNEVHFEVTFAEIFQSVAKKRKVCRLQLCIGGVVQLEIAIKITPCGRDSSLVVVTNPGFKVLSGKPVTEDDDSLWETIENTGLVTLIALTADARDTVSVLVDQAVSAIDVDSKDSRVCKVATLLDPSASPSGLQTVVISNDKSICRLELEATATERGEFTLERELIVRLAEGNKARLNRLVDIFVGSKSDPYPFLGGLTDATRARCSLVEAFENKFEGGYPVIADLFSFFAPVPPVVSGHIRVWGSTQPGRLGSFQPTQRVLETVGRYLEARNVVIAEIAQGLPPPDGRWPQYAWYPTFVEKRRNALELAIKRYLNEFINVGEFLQRNRGTLSWEEAFLLSNLDRVVQWSGSPENGNYSLISPWHPLVIAKRFMTQESALGSVRRFLATSVGNATNRLAVLLDQIQAFRWIPTLGLDGVDFDHAYVSATSDPGWMVAISVEALDQPSTEKFVWALRRGLGLSVTLLPVAQERMATSFFRQFQNAHPSRRSISLSAEPIYSSDLLVESAQALLYEGEDVSASGRLLPGGLHLFLDEVDEIQPVAWREPPIAVYNLDRGASWQDSYRDIHLLAPAKPKLSRIMVPEQLFPRASGDKAVFASPVHRITVGAGGVPRSFAFERDVSGRSGDSVGDLFVTALHSHSLLAGSPRAAGWVVELPENLKFLWNVIPGGQIDPAVLVHYSRTGFDTGESRVLWDYNMSLTGPASSYFVLSKVPESVAIALGGSPVLRGKEDAKKIIQELSTIGLAIGSESLQTGAKALGVIGTVAAIRLLKGGGDVYGPVASSDRSRGFILPVDSFREILGAGLDSDNIEGLDARRADLIAFSLRLNHSDVLSVCFSAIECKYSSYTFSDEDAQDALAQAQRTYDRLFNLAEVARAPSGLPERLALISLICFGLRLNSATDDSMLTTDQLIVQKLIDGDYLIESPLSSTVVFITECLRKAPMWKKTAGLEVRVCPDHWPGVSETAELSQIRQYLRNLLGQSAIEKSILQSTSHNLSEPDNTNVTERDGATLSSKVQPEKIPNLREGLPIKPTEKQTNEDSQLRVSETVAKERLLPILLGTTVESRRVYFDPQSESRPLDNYNVMITGSSGKGKTQLIKAIVADLRRQDRNVFMIDFKNDFASDRVFLGLSRLACRYVTFDGLPFNPLIPMPVSHPATGRQVLQISQYITGITSVLRETFGLGAQQESDLKDVIRDCYRDCGLDPSGTVEHRPDTMYPDFNDVGNRLRQANPLAYNRMDPLFDLGVFSSASRRVTFESSISESCVIDLSQIQSDAIKYAIAKILIISAHSYYNSRPHSPNLRHFFVFDEAHRVLDQAYVARFSRECRAYGVGLLLSSQNPMDFPEEISASLNTKILHGNGSERERVRDIIKTLGGAPQEEEVAQLGGFDAYISSPHYVAQRLKTLAYPHYLVLEAIRRTPGAFRSELKVEGVVTARLSIDYLVGTLTAMGLIKEENGRLFLK